MRQLTRIWDSTALSKSLVYHIDGCLYRFLYSDPYARVDHPQYLFRPLAGQRRKADLQLNHRQLTAKVYEVEGMQARNATVEGNGIQMTLDLGRLEGFRGF